jgi:hypothetical protein
MHEKMEKNGMQIFKGLVRSSANQGCQIFLGTTYQNGEKYTYQMTTKYNNWP